MPIDKFTIEIEHHEPISMEALTEGLSIIYSAMERGTLDLLASLREDFGSDFLPPEFWTLASEEAHLRAQETLWLVEVEPGSSKFHGVLKPLIIGVIAGLLSRAAFDVIKETRPWQDFRTAAVQRIDEGYYRSMDYINKPSEAPDPKKPRVRADLIETRIRFTVTPSLKQREFMSKG